MVENSADYDRFRCNLTDGAQKCTRLARQAELSLDVTNPPNLQNVVAL